MMEPKGILSSLSNISLPSMPVSMPSMPSIPSMSVTLPSVSLSMPSVPVLKFTSGDSRYLETSQIKIDQIVNDLGKPNPKDKLDALSHLLGFIIMGRDASMFYPDVVKNVICPNIEVKKLVYAYLVHYSERKPEIALLSINSFQKDLADSNQWIRAMALRVMSSIRVPVILQLVILAISRCTKDVSPYVRKTAAHAIPKVFDLDRDHKDQLVGILKTLLSDNTAMVIGSALFAFLEVCPDDWTIIHPHYRKICRMLPDFDEWGQIVALNLLIRYARTHFPDPRHPSELAVVSDSEEELKTKKKKSKKAAFYSDDSSSDEKTKKKSKKSKKNSNDLANFYSDDESDGGNKKKSKKSKEREREREKEREKERQRSKSEAYERSRELSTASQLDTDMDSDHRLLLRAAAPLLQSRNSGVVLAVATVFYYTAPAIELPRVGKALIRLTNSHREIAYVILANIATFCSSRPAMFAPHLKTFFVKSADLPVSQLLKIEIMSSLAPEYSNNPTVMRLFLGEFGAYTKFANPDVVKATIQAIGRCAIRVPSMLELCVRKLLRLVSSTEETVVGESIITLRCLLLRDEDKQFHLKAITKFVRYIDTLTVPLARASIVWMMGEFFSVAPRRITDCFRKLAKTFINEEDEVKIQVMRACAKIYLNDPSERMKLLLTYILELAKFDPSCDLRDAGRLFYAVLFNPDLTALHETQRILFLSSKPPAKLGFNVKDGRIFITNSLSHIVDHAVIGYRPLPEFPLETLSAEARDQVAETNFYRMEADPMDRSRRAGGYDDSNFYGASDSDSSSSSSSGSSSSSPSSRSSRSSSASSKSSSSESESSDASSKSSRSSRSSRSSSSSDSESDSDSD
eukprot:TRINITY_DN2324_c0_g1::TRINITY_DN2324_c0_g1_i1::g.20669::m.20669 TRINITY_DN2324_c0_g1::TRINITY_DN2324_c0_g1_i1::g.20669  ORF type:complete len:858 (+),score=244.39,sp/Q7YRF1/AP3B1_CANLF/39.46/1e-148,Adaptin_N/PF01602.15/9.5e-113,HEAT_2/PF13646.1/0.00065,HEAT_2/PF13646.1/1.7e+03,HEAT_2/PF13646.1/5.9,HEAT_2/PF13646.1/65,Cnd1/PF12717.2/6.2e-05,Cnd1/PF12717.2/10,Cnd1/PF12717.2/90,HEAT/PF02985.17/1.6e+02,HEAT/PF02985.17/2.3,HEAT/PF02985.17/1.1e+02,HEAT/PF02985.17/3.6e+02,HEAT_EZ/PF13513.1/65,HEAT_EZ/P